MAISRPRYQQKKRRYQKKRTGTKFKQGYFTDISEKYIQPQNKYLNSEHFPKYRSSWELQFMKYCEASEKVKKWTVESIAIPYIHPNDNEQHRYFPDFMILMQDDNKNIIKFLIEIKPSNQKNNPINKAKWEAAEKWCKERGYKFIILTEKELKQFGII